MVDAKADCEELLTALLPFAEQMLSKHGEFYPFGGVKLADGEFNVVAGYEGDGQPATEAIIETLKKGLRAGAAEGRYRATALVYDVRVRMDDDDEPSDAVAVALDHRAHYSVLVVFPYTLEGSAVRFARPVAQEGDYAIFGGLAAG